jgi:hypothetical protein
MPAISFAHPKINMQIADEIAPAIMKGLRRPYLLRLLSEIIPMIGCIRSPPNGPASHTSDSLLLLRPRARRYGVAYVISVL